MQDTEDDIINRLMAAGATDQEIIDILKEKKAKSQTAGASAPVASVVAPKREESFFSSVKRDSDRQEAQFKSSLLGGLSGTAKAVADAASNPLGASMIPGAGAVGMGARKLESFLKSKAPKEEELRAPAGQSKVGRLADGISSFAGSVAGELPLSMATSGIVNPVLGPLGKTVLGGVAKTTAGKVLPKAASAMMREAIEVGITTIPQEVIAGSIAEAIIRPEAFQDWKSVLRVGALSSIGTVFNAGGAYFNAIKKANAEELLNIQGQLKELNDEIADAYRVMPPTPEAPAGPVMKGNTPLPSQLEAAQGKVFDKELATGGQLPTHREAAWRRMNEKLNEEIEKRLVRLETGGPKAPEPDPLLEAASKPIPDPLMAAQVKGIEERLSQQLEVMGGGKGAQTAPGVDLGIVTTPNMFLTLDELNDHLRVLNMASVSSQPTFKRGQRFIVPRTQLKTAEEIAARVTGGPIKAIDKTIQASFTDIQGRLDAASLRGVQTLDPAEAAEVVAEMLSMSRRLSRGFEVPRTANLPLDGTPRPDVGRYVDGFDISTSAKLDDPDLTSQIDPTGKRWVTGSGVEPERGAFNVVDRRAGANVPPAGTVDITEMPPTPPAVKEVTEAYADAVRNMNIDYTKKQKGVVARIFDKIKDAKTEFYDRTWGVGKYDPEARQQLSLLSGVSAYAEEFYENQMRVAVRDPDGVFRGNTRPVEGVPLKKLIDGIKMDQYTEANAYLKALTLRDQIAKDPKFISDVPLATIEAVIRNAPEEVKKLGQGFKVIADALVEDGVATGRFSAARAEDMRKSFYAGLSRSLNNSRGQNAFAARAGSKKASLPPIQLMRDNIFKMLEANRKNAAYARLVTNYELNPDKFKGAIQPVDLPSAMEAVPGYTQMVDDFMKDGMTYNEATQLASMEIPLFDTSNGTLRVFRDGKMSLWKVNEDIQKTMTALSPVEFDTFRALLTAISAPLRTTTSLALDISGVGPVSDTFLTAAKAPGFIPFVSSLEGLFHSALKTDKWQERIAAGGGYGGRFEPAEVVVYKDANATAVGRATETVMHPLKFMQAIVRPLSDAARMGEYLSRTRAGESPVQAALASRNTLGDFNRVGASMRGWSLATEFGNVGIQTAGAAAELGKNAIAEAKRGNVAPLLRLTATAVGGIMLPTYYFWAEAQKDEQLNALRKADTGYRYWWTRLPFDTPGIGEKGDIVKYPKPGWWMGQAFGSSFEAYLDGMDEDARRRMVDGMWSQIGINPIPIKAQQAFGLLTNSRNPLALGQSNIPITPQNQQNLDPSVQGNERTSPLARGLADNVGINPFITDYITESAGGNFFGSIIRMVGPNPVKLEGADVPILGRFGVRKNAPTEGSSLFYRDIEQARKFDESFQKAVESNDFDKARKLQEENAVLIAFRKDFEKFAKDIGETNKFIRSITMDPNISPEGKREYINDLRDYQNEVFMMYADQRKGWKQ
jgi:hypothetical protein